MFVVRSSEVEANRVTGLGEDEGKKKAAEGWRWWFSSVALTDGKHGRSIYGDEIFNRVKSYVRIKKNSINAAVFKPCLLELTTLSRQPY